MAGLLELLAQWVDETGQPPSDAVVGAADRVRASGEGRRARDREAANRRADDIERISKVLGLEMDR